MRILNHARRQPILLVAAIASAVLAALPAAASARTSTNFDPVRIDGYKVSISAYNGSARLNVDKHLPRLHGTSYVTYGGSDSGTGKHVISKFGKFGKLNMRFHKTGAFKPLDLPARCTGTPDKSAKGTWKGSIQFRSEQGLVKIHRDSWSGTLTKPGRTKCHYPSQKYVSLVGDGDSPRGTLSLEAARITTSEKTSLFAGLSERKKGSGIDRGVALNADVGDFHYNGALLKATAHSSGPFSGKARYRSDGTEAGAETIGSIGGNLEVTFLGESKPVPFKIKSAYMRRSRTG